MSRFERKCFVGSAALHGLLLGAFVFGAAFLPSGKPEKLPPVITIFDTKVTDRMIASGGNPNGNPDPPAPAPKPPKLEPTPPPPPPKPEPKEVVKQEPKKEVKPVEKPEPPKTSKKDLEKVEATKPKINTTVSRRTNDVALQQFAAQRATKQQAERKYQQDVARYNEARERLANQVNGIVGGVGKSLNKSTVVEAIGPGGRAYANYNSLVREIYDRAWRITQDLMEIESSATAEITIRRDGRVVSAVISRRSGNSALDRSVRSALDAVREIGKPFPEESKDAERTFTIEFKPITRKGIG